MDYDDEYEQFDDFNYDDVAEDWEAEAEQEEKNAIAEEVARAARKREKLNVRAPEAQETDEEPLSADIQSEITNLRAEAQQYKESRITGALSEKIISDMPADSQEDVKAIADSIVSIIAKGAKKNNFKQVVDALRKSLVLELKDTLLLNKEITRMTFLAKKMGSKSQNVVEAHTESIAPANVDVETDDKALNKDDTTTSNASDDEGSW